MRAVKILINVLLAMYFVGIAITYFRLDDEQTNSSIAAWVFGQDFIFSIRAVAWPYYAFAALINDEASIGHARSFDASEPPPEGHVVEYFQKKAWWLPEYQRLNMLLDKHEGSLGFSYLTGPNNSAVAKMWLSRAANRSLIVKVDLPSESLQAKSHSDIDTNSSDRFIIEMRDHDLDGWIDDFRMPSNLNPMYSEKLTKDGFVTVRDSSEHGAIMFLWAMAMAVTTNHFLHSRDSVFQK